jgi:hypothetical protein
MLGAPALHLNPCMRRTGGGSVNIQPLLDALDLQEDAARALAEDLRTQIDGLQTRLREAEMHLEHLAITRKTVTGLADRGGVAVADVFSVLWTGGEPVGAQADLGWHRGTDCHQEPHRNRTTGCPEVHAAAGERRAFEVHAAVDGDPGEIEAAALPGAVSALGDAVLVSDKAQDRMPDLTECVIPVLLVLMGVALFFRG